MSISMARYVEISVEKKKKEKSETINKSSFSSLIVVLIIS